MFFWDGIDNWDRGEWERGSGMTVTITATMDSLLLRLFLLCFHFKPFTNKKKLDYICLVAWFMFQMVMFLRRLNSYIFTQNNNYKGIGIVFFRPRTLGGNVTKKNVYRTSYKSSLLVFTTVKSMVFFFLLLRNILHLSLHAKKRGVIPLQC